MTMRVFVDERHGRCSGDIDRNESAHRSFADLWPQCGGLGSARRAPAGEDGVMAERLRNATSPYLLQHADNPVDWWPWSDEAFEAARDRDVPVMLSVGYSD